MADSSLEKCVCPDGYTLPDVSPSAPTEACITGCPDGYTLSDICPSAPTGACITGCPDGYNITNCAEKEIYKVLIINKQGDGRLRKGTFFQWDHTNLLDIIAEDPFQAPPPYEEVSREFKRIFVE